MADRRYAGLDSQERASIRREQLLAAGLEVFADTGWAASTVHDVCRTAGLSPRYFYEAFRSREALFLAITARIASEVEATVLAALPSAEDPVERAHAVLTALAAYFTSDPRRIRVALMESLATEEFRANRRELMFSFSALGARLMRPLRPGTTVRPAVRLRLEMSATVLTGGLVEALIGWSADGASRSTVPVVDHLTALYLAAARL